MVSVEDRDWIFDIDKFKEEFGTTITHAAGYLYQRVRSDEIRYNIWDGQSEDGRKWSQSAGTQPFPWEGAADTRTFFVDQCINELVEMKLSALKRARSQAVPIGNTGTSPEANLHTQILDFTVKNKIGEEWMREWESLLQWTETYGLAAMSVYWRRDTDIEEVTVTIQDIMQLAAQDQNLANMLQKIESTRDISDEDYEALGEIFKVYFPGDKVKSSIQSLMKKGWFKYDREYLRVNRPTIKALRVLEDIFFPINTFALQEAKWVVRRDICTLPEVIDRSKVEGWDEKFTDSIINTLGNSIIAATYYNTWRVRITNNVFVDDVWDRIEVYYAYTHEVDKDGKRRTYETVFHPSITGYGKREVFAYDHGKFPFVEFPRERVTRSILESRGVPQIIGPIQAEIKLQRDSRVDRTSLATLPPLKVPLGRGRMNINMGPSTQIPVGPGGDVSWLNPPPMDTMSLEIETLLSNDARSYLGQYNDGADPNKILLRQQVLIDRFLGGVKEVCNQIHQLNQQYISDEDVQKITGQPGFSMHAGRSDIQGEFDLSIEFDARDLNMEFLTGKLKAITEMVAPNDTSGSIDRNYLTKWLASSIDPTFARDGIKSADSATQKEIEDEKNNLAQICCGIEPPMVDKGQNYQLRLQVLQNTLQQSPSVQQTIGQDKYKQEILQNRMKFLTFQVQQQKNANIGRVGTQAIQQ
jgi:hypothetical protein